MENYVLRKWHTVRSYRNWPIENTRNYVEILFTDTVFM